MKILVTGATGQTFGPVAETLAKSADEVWCLARFKDPRQREQFEAAGFKTAVWNMGADNLDHVPDDFTHVLHAATMRDSDDPQEVMSINSVGTGMLMTHCRKAKAFLVVSTFSVYRPMPLSHPYAETDPVSGNSPARPAYGASKMIQEGAAHAYARTLGLPTVIARMNTAYGPKGRGGIPVRFLRMMLEGAAIPVPLDGEDEWHNPIHADDLARQIPLLWDVADIVPTTTNWAGDDVISIREMVDYISEISGVEAKFQPTLHTLTPKASNNDRRHSLIGPCEVNWRDGIKRALQAQFPERTFA